MPEWYDTSSLYLDGESKLYFWVPEEYALQATYTIRFHKNDWSGTDKTASRTFTHGEKTLLPLLKNGLGWERVGYRFLGWSLSSAGGKIWKPDWGFVATPVPAYRTLCAYAVWTRE